MRRLFFSSQIVRNDEARRETQAAWGIEESAVAAAHEVPQTRAMWGSHSIAGRSKVLREHLTIQRIQQRGVAMRSWVTLLTGTACISSAAAMADTFTGTCTCGGKSDPQHELMLPAGDRPDHQLGVEAYKCVWTKPLEIAGDKTKDGVATDVVDIKGIKVTFHGVHEVTLQSGDKIALSYQGSGTSENKKNLSKGTFTIAEGTGKLKGIKGKGTFDCKPAGEDQVSCDVDGEYELGK